MPTKRKRRSDTDPIPSKLPRLRPRSKPQPEKAKRQLVKRKQVKRVDPLTALPINCVSLILDLLDTKSLARLERVKEWKQLVYSWIGTSSKHYASLIPEVWRPDLQAGDGLAAERVSVLREAAARQHRMVTGKSTGVREWKDVAYLKVEGDWAVWLVQGHRPVGGKNRGGRPKGRMNRGMFAQKLGFADNGRKYTVRHRGAWAKFGDEWPRAEDVHLSAGGYLVVRTDGGFQRETDGFTKGYVMQCEHAFSLETGRRVWSHGKVRDVAGHHSSTIVAVGEESIYSVERGSSDWLDADQNQHFLMTRDLATGALSSKAALPDGLLVQQKRFLLQLGGREVIARVVFDSHTTRRHVIEILEPEDAQVLQQIQVQGWNWDLHLTKPHSTSLHLQTRFAVLSSNFSPGTMKIEMYAEAKDGSVFRKSTHVLELNVSVHSNTYPFCIDPSRQLILGTVCKVQGREQRTEYQVTSWAPAAPRSFNLQEIEPGLQVDACWRRGNVCGIELPRRTGFLKSMSFTTQVQWFAGRVLISDSRLSREALVDFDSPIPASKRRSRRKARKW